MAGQRPLDGGDHFSGRAAVGTGIQVRRHLLAPLRVQLTVDERVNRAADTEMLAS